MLEESARLFCRKEVMGMYHGISLTNGRPTFIITMRYPFARVLGALLTTWGKSDSKRRDFDK